MKVKTREKEVEEYFRRRCMIELRAECLKFLSPSTAGVPDRIVLIPPGFTVFAETKRPGGEPTDIQRYWLRTLDQLGFRVYVVDSKERADEVIEELKELQAEVREQMEDDFDEIQTS